ncbi:lytic transglycosylase domain-containing protein [Lentibacter sp. XHP0401]|uniref:lytic transglycosylase domain-containing protein n=1 Tax=Lentibacter sp. XHP0401 TaxID=2984334 RepID=UPI0021E7BAC2|nr:lytic transglycosylase domain-containing protein [Lentibacter sp. XHP0401]MCV2894839.1 lytic transglycosylase domain-containing protein [Lentibacter sp. XHP0401]
MFLRAAVLSGLTMLPIAAFAEAFAAPRPLSSAMHAAGRGDWAAADMLAAKAAPEARVLMQWIKLRAGKGSAGEVLAFLRDYPHWPGLERLGQQSEDAFAEASNAERLAFFKTHTAQSNRGVLSYVEALLEAGERGEAEATLVMAWRSFDMDDALQAEYLEKHADLLAPHHEARLDMVLWRGLSDDVRRMLPLVSADQRALAEARQGLRAGAPDPEVLLAAVPEDLRGHPGLAYEEFLWHYHRGSKERAIKLMISNSAAGNLGEPLRWSGWRRSLVRQIMREGDVKTAYALSLNHGLFDGSAYADLEWLGGYLTLKKLDDAAKALAHFERMKETVESPISLGRAGFWKGEALEKLGRTEEALAAYKAGGQHQTSFYGLLAAERANLGSDIALKGAEYFPAWQAAAFAKSDLARIVELAVKNNMLSLAEQFILAMAEDADRTTLGQLGNFATDLGAPHLAVMLGKDAAGRGIVLPAHYYALHPMTEMPLPVPMEMALAIARRESEFDPSVASGVGALGLMQVMPATAKEVAEGIGLEYERARVLSDWRYNVTLGSAYLATLSERYDGNVVMMSAAYNAGPSRPDRWMSERGDPRKGEVDMIDWIESIPFDETRNYVMRVAESLPVYRARMGKAAHPVPFSQELVGATLRAGN